MTTDIIVRELQPQDLEKTPEVCKLVNDAFRSEESWTTDRHLISTERITLAAFSEMIDKNHDPNIFLYAVDGDEIVGTIQIVLEKGQTGALLSYLAVKPSHQSRGVGNLLMRESIRYVRENLKDRTEAVIHVLESRPELLVWYKKIGFQDTNETLPFHDNSILLIEKTHFVVLNYPL